MRKSIDVKKNRCLFLMLSLVGLLLIYHFFLFRPLVILALLSTTLIAAVYAVSGSRKHTIIAAIIGTMVVIFMFADFVHSSIFLNLCSSVLLAVFFIFTLIQTLIYVIRGQKVTRDKIYGAISVYFLIGMAWSPLYRLVYVNDSSAFSGTPQLIHEGVHHFDFIYYSFETLCTLGFGDILPVSGLARSLTLLEAMTGVLYMAVMISRLVSLYKTDEEE